MNRFPLLILIVSASSSLVVESQRNFSELLETIVTNETTSTTTAPLAENATKIYPKQRSQARFEVREKYNSLLAGLENSIGDEYYEGDYYDDEYNEYYFDYEEAPAKSGEEFPELARLLSNEDEFFKADDRFKGPIKKRRVKRSSLPFPRHHRMDHIGYRPPHYMEGVDFTLETVFGLPMADYYVSRYGVHSPMDSMPHGSGYSAPKTGYSADASYKKPMAEPSYVAPRPQYAEPPKPAYQTPVTPEYVEPAKPVYHKPSEPVYRTPDYHEPPKLEYISPKKPTHRVPQYHDPQLDYRSPKRPGIVLPVKKRVSGYKEEEYAVGNSKYQTPIYYSSKSAAPFFQPRKPSRRPAFPTSEDNGYAVYYLPYDQYVMEYPEYGLNPRIPTLPGNAHFLVASPHRPPSLAGKKRRKRSAPSDQGSQSKRQSQ
eukprot:TRINITY_DN2604_c0_g1_i1.p1 TRINITY_DN2604_c0_g1~~TRINITY_DN2604_c0_g1_i1.p1  ORF type:complete len:428 (-),score=60.41 TRINITY_DN2604_c0_g1_i1:151-1434(-)